MKLVKGKQILVMGLVALVLIAGYYRWTEESKARSVPVMTDAVPIQTDQNGSGKGEANGGTATGSTTGNSNYFAKARQDRDVSRSESIDLLKEVLNSSTATAEDKKETQDKISEAAKNIEKESIIEGLVKAKGYADCIVYIDNSNVSVIVKAESLDAPKVSQIKDIVVAQTSIKATNIKISNV